MVNASAYYPGWMRDKEAADKKNFANISYVAIPYGVISDSSIKVTDDEINKYVQAHKDQFKQEAGRMISFVSFSQKPDGADSSRVRTAVESLKSAFAGETNDMAFLSRNTSTIPFDSTYQPKSKFNNAVIDSIIRASASARRSPVPSSATRGSCSSTTVSRRWTRRPSPRSSRTCARCSAGARRCSSPTASPPRNSPTRSSCSTKAASSNELLAMH